jgi:malate dehydrogenase
MIDVAVLGAGDIGGACALALAESDQVHRVTIIDSAGKAAEGKALDIRQSGAIGGFDTAVVGTDDPARTVGASVWVLADRFETGSPEWNGDRGLALLRQLGAAAASAPIVFAGTTQRQLMALAAAELQIPERRLVGSAPEALAAAIRAIVGVEADCSPGDVSLAVLGVPPSIVVPWDDATIGGFGLSRMLSAAQLARVEARAAKLWPPGPYALGAVAAEAVKAIVQGSRGPLNVLTVLTGEFGVRGRVGVVPSFLGPAGITRTRVPPLDAKERVSLETALQA